jgi:oligopeptide/dipeptide ABC transporter ATP-binding protein
MYGGLAFEVGDTRTLFYESRNPYTQGLLTSTPRWSDREDVRLEPIPGAPPSILALPEGCAFSPRCRYATDICRQTEPELEAVADLHWSRCHHKDSLPDLDLRARSAK